MSSPLRVAIAADGRLAYEIGAAARVNPSQLSKLAHCHAVPTEAVKARLADVLGVPVAELFPDPVDRLVDQAVEQGHGRRVTNPAALRRVAELVRSGDAAPPPEAG
jgi:hypothetical protein